MARRSRMVMSAVLGDGNPTDRAFFELGALPTCPDVFLRLPDTDDVQRVLAGRAVMPQEALLIHVDPSLAAEQA